MTTRQRIDLHLVATFAVGVPLGILLLWMQVRPLTALVVMVAFACAMHLLSPRCPKCGNNVFREESPTFGTMYNAFTVRCGKCGVVWSKV